jgi:hypothetical protein
MTVYRKSGNAWTKERQLRGSWWVRLEMWIRRLMTGPGS